MVRRHHPVAQPASGDAGVPEQRQRARAFAEPLIGDERLDSGEGVLAHADAMADILAGVGASPSMQGASYLVYACVYLNKPREVITKSFGPGEADLAIETSKLLHVQQLARGGYAPDATPEQRRAQTDNVRKMLLAFSRDLRVVMLRLASRLQTLRYYASSGRPTPADLAQESADVFGPLANRLGVWDIKWELEDLILRAQEPDTYRMVASMLDEKRIEREADLERRRCDIANALKARGIDARVSGRPKHIYSIVKKMRGKGLDFNQVFDVRALRVIVPDVADCYAALDCVHNSYTPVPDEFDDYIARPKPNGYQSLHTVVRDERGKPMEVQIRTATMHEHAEHGVAAHWAYKEAGAKGYGGAVTANSSYDAKIAVLRQLLAWEQDLSGAVHDRGLFDDHIYVLTPEAAVVELTRGATPVDFAYAVHTSVGHRCRGARVDGHMVPLNTPLQNGQTVEILTAKEGGPSRDWLNPELGYLAGQRARAKVRAWFNAQLAEEHVTRGREMVERLLQREGKTAVKLDDLATDLGFKSAEQLFEVVGKDEFSLRPIEALLRPTLPQMAEPELQLRKASADTGKGGVLVVGVGSLLTHLARCCKPAPPDAIGGFVTRGKGVSIHRLSCPSLAELRLRDPERLIDVTWSGGGAGRRSEGAVYPVDVAVAANDRQGLLRDISEVFTKQKMNVVGVQTHSSRGTAWMTFTVELGDTQALTAVLSAVRQVPGVRTARRA